MYPWQVFKLSVFPPRPSFSSGSLQSQIPRTHSPVSRLQLHTAKEIASVSPSTIIGNYTARACRDAIHLKVNIMFMTRRRPKRVKALSSEPRRSSLLALARQVITLVKFGNSLTPAWMQAASSVLCVFVPFYARNPLKPNSSQSADERMQRFQHHIRLDSWTNTASSSSDFIFESHIKKKKCIHV